MRTFLNAARHHGQFKLAVMAFLCVFSLTAGAVDLASDKWSNWNVGSQQGGSISYTTVSVTNDTIIGGYPTATGGTYAWAAYKVNSLNTYELYIEFDAKMPGAKQGLKFLKVFGQKGADGGYANTTFATDYTGYDIGGMYAVAFGDGRSKGNDTTQLLKFDGSDPSWIGRSYGTAVVKTPQKTHFKSSDWGTGWHHFKFYLKFNSGTTADNEVPDGKYYVEIDGKVYVDASGLFNRYYTNGPIDRITLFDWAQNGSSPFEVWYRGVHISTTGFKDAPAVVSPPNPPNNLKVITQ